MELKKSCIRCKPSYTYGDYIYFNNSIDALRKDHNQFTFNHEPEFYITSLSNLMDETLKLLPELFLIK